MKFWMALWLCLSGQFLNAQVIPDSIDVNENQELPHVFPLAESHFIFKSTEAITEAKIISDTSQWLIEKNEEGQYVVKCKVYRRSQSLDFDSTVQIQLTFAEGDPITLIAPIRIYTDVKIVPYGKSTPEALSPNLKCTDSYGFHILWEYPSYVKKRWRVYGVFEMVIALDGERIDGFNGWYDSGDRSKMRSFEIYPKTGELTIRVKRVKTLHKYTQNGKYFKLELSEGYPNEWVFVGGE